MVTYGFFNSVYGDRKYDADQMSDFYTGIVTQGVFQHVDNGLEVTAGTGLTVSVNTGRAIIQNKWVKNDTPLILELAPAPTTYGRFDRVVLKYDSNSRNVQIIVKTGTPAGTPAAPELVREGGIYEMCLAEIDVEAGATSVTVIDTRSDTALCGWAAVAQATSGEVDQMLDDMKTGYDGVVYSTPGEAIRSCDQKLQNEVNTIGANQRVIYNTMENFGTWEEKEKSFESGAYYKIIDGTAVRTASSNFRNYVASVEENQVLILTTRTYGNPATPLVILADSNNKVISAIYDTTITPTSSTKIQFTVPKGAIYVYCNGYGSISSLKILKAVQMPAPTNNSIQDFMAEYVSNNLNVSEISGMIETRPGYIEVNGVTNVMTLNTSQSNYRTMAASVTEGSFILINTRVGGQTISACFVDNNSKVIQTVPMTAASGFVQMILKVPTGATKIYVTSYANAITMYNVTAQAPIKANGAIYYSVGAKPYIGYQWTRSSSATVTVTLPQNAIEIYAPFGQKTKKYSIPATQEPREFTLASSNALIWDLTNNTIHTCALTEIPVDSITLLVQEYGVPTGGLWYPFFEEKYGEGIMDLTQYVGQLYAYNRSYCQEKLAEYRSLELTTGDNGDTFVFVTDTHNQPGLRNNQESPKLISNICKGSNLKKVIFGGDMIYAYGSEQDMYEQMWIQIQAYKQWVSPWADVYNVIGNHDIKITEESTGTVYQLPNSQVYEAMFTDQENRIIQNESDILGMYYYFDNTKRKIRYVCLNSEQSDKTAQVAWLTNIMSAAPQDYHFVIVCHVPMISEQSADYDRTTVLYNVIKPYAERIIVCLAGHTHSDQLTIKNGIVHMTSNADARIDRSGDRRTPDHGAFDILCVNMTDSRVDSVRVGKGSNRAFTFGSNPTIIDDGTNS